MGRDAGEPRVDVDLTEVDPDRRAGVSDWLDGLGVPHELDGSVLRVPPDQLEVVQGLLEEAVDFHELRREDRPTYGLAPRWRRFVGYVAEALVLGCLSTAVVAGFRSPLALLVSTTVVSLVNGVVAVALRGRTLGMVLLDMRVVVPPDHRPPGWKVAWIRWAVVNLPILVATWLNQLVVLEQQPGILPLVGFAGWIAQLAAYTPILWDRYHRGWHDRLAGTVVIAARYHGPLDQFESHPSAVDMQ